MLAYKKVVSSIQHWLNIYCLVVVSQVAFVAKNLSANLEDTRDTGSILSQEGPLEEEMATHSSILAWKIPWTGEPGRLQSMGSQRVRHNWCE